MGTELWLKKIADACDRVARGDLEARILGCDDEGEIGRVVHGLNRLLDITDAFVREARATLDEASHGRFYRRVIVRGLPGTFREAAELINAATEKMHAQADALDAARSERLEMANTFEHTIEGVIATIASSATELQATAGAMVSTSMATTEQSVAVATAAKQMSESVHAVATATEKMRAASRGIESQIDGSTSLARSAVEEVESAKTTVDTLAQASREIGQVVKLISEIAKQTNLLALNATIEAARVGEAGKGFTVVASEVKSLSRQSAGATETIAATVASIQTAARQGVDAIARIDRAIHGFEEATTVIDRNVADQRRVSEAIDDTVRDAARGTDDVTRNIDLVATAARETTEAAHAVHRTASDVAEQAERLRVATFDLLAVIRGK